VFVRRNASFYVINAGQAETTLSWFDCKKRKAVKKNFACYVNKAKQTNSAVAVSAMQAYRRRGERERERDLIILNLSTRWR
jgi:hypothetical protein